jgi:hypothetical protein
MQPRKFLLSPLYSTIHLVRGASPALRRLELNEFNMFWYLFRRVLTWHRWLILNSEMMLPIGTSVRHLTLDR